MSFEGKARLLKIYLNEDSKYKSHNLYHALILKFKEMGIAGATVTRGVEGYGQSRMLHTMKILELSSSLPIIIEVVDTPENIDKIIPVAKEMVNEGLIMTADVEVIKYGERCQK